MVIGGLVTGLVCLLHLHACGGVAGAVGESIKEQSNTKSKPLLTNIKIFYSSSQYCGPQICELRLFFVSLHCEF